MTKNLIYRWTSISIPFGELATCLGDVAYCEELVDNLDNANNASGKFGGVAGVLAGAHNCNKKLKGFITKKYNRKTTHIYLPGLIDFRFSHNDAAICYCTLTKKLQYMSQKTI